VADDPEGTQEVAGSVPLVPAGGGEPAGGRTPRSSQSDDAGLAADGWNSPIYRRKDRIVAIVLGFEDPKVHGEIIAELERLRASDTVRMIDSLAVYKVDGKAQVRQATQQFESRVRSIAQSLGSVTSLSTAESQLKPAVDQLADSHKQTLAKVDCS
jgi:hypothetical protein